jgi:hypothetical protein
MEVKGNLKVLDQAMVFSVLDDICDRDQLDTMFFCKLVTVVPTGHGSIAIIDQFTDHGHRLQTGQLAEIDGSLSVSEATNRTTLSITQGQDMSRSVKILGGLCRVSQGSAGQGTIMSRDTSCGSVCVIDRDSIGRLHQFLVVGDHQRQVEFL